MTRGNRSSCAPQRAGGRRTLRRLGPGLALGLSGALGITLVGLAPATAGTPRLLRSVGIGGYPQAVAVSPDGSTAWVSDTTDNEIVAVGTQTGHVIERISVPGAPTGIAVSPDGSTVYVVGLAGNLSVVSVALGEVTRTIVAGGEDDPGDEAVRVVLGPDGATAYVSLFGGAVSVIDLASGTVTDLVWIGAYADGLVLSPDGRTLYAASCQPATLSAIDTATDTVTGTVAAGSCDGRVALSPDGSTAWVAGSDDGLQVVRTHPFRLARTIGLSTTSLDIALSPDGSTAYVTLPEAGSVDLIDTATGSVTQTVSAGSTPAAIAVSPDGYTAWIADVGDDALAAFDTGTAAPPWIAAQPVDRTVPAGRTATFSVAVRGPLSPTVRWQLKVPGGYWNDIPRATSTTYTTGRLSVAQSGRSYRAIATNREGSVSSGAARVTVTAAP
jgi:YVTN family beta-propeller protein